MESDTPQGHSSTKNDTHNPQKGSNAGGRPIMTEQGTESNRCNYQAQPHPTFWRRIDWSQVVLDLLLLIVGIKLACIYSGQLNQMIELNRISRESLTSVQRAFVVAKAIGYEISFALDEDGKQQQIVNFTAQLENGGNTPAKGIYQSFAGSQLLREPTEEEFLREEPVSAPIIGPKAPHTMGIVRRNILDILPSVPAVSTKIGDEGEYFWGWITYRDMFEGTAIHLTEFCYQIASKSVLADAHGRASAPYRNPQFIFSSCRSHTCTDDTCEDYAKVIALKPTQK